MRRLVIPAVLAVTISSGAALRAGAEGLMGMQSGDLRISTDATDYDIATGDFTMPHHVAATRPGTQIDGDHAHGNGKTKIVVLEGHVVVHNTGDSSDSGLLSNSNSHDPSTLTTDRLTIELTPKLYTADGHVHFVQGTRTATADRATLDDRTHDLHLMGNVHLTDSGQSLEAATLDYNTATEQAHAKDNVRIIVPLATASPGLAPTAAPPSRHSRR